MDDMAERIAKLPTWVRDHIKRLTDAPETIRRQLVETNKRLEHAEQQRRKLPDRLDAVHDLLKCAARGGHETARAYVDRLIAEYQSEPEPEKPAPDTMDAETRAWLEKP